MESSRDPGLGKAGLDLYWKANVGRLPAVGNSSSVESLTFKQEAHQSPICIIVVMILCITCWDELDPDSALQNRMFLYYSLIP